jgi:hypothetical protein
VPRTLDVVAASAAPYVAMLAAGCVVVLIGIIWFLRTKHLRALWHRADHDVAKVAMMLELEDRVRELEQTQASRSPGRP